MYNKEAWETCEANGNSAAFARRPTEPVDQVGLPGKCIGGLAACHGTLPDSDGFRWNPRESYVCNIFYEFHDSHYFDSFYYSYNSQCYGTVVCRGFMSLAS